MQKYSCHLFTIPKWQETNCNQADSEVVIATVKRFLDNGCGCSRGHKGGPCSQQFLVEAALSNLNYRLELTHAELDLVILANIQVFTRINLEPGEKQKRNP